MMIVIELFCPVDCVDMLAEHLFARSKSIPDEQWRMASNLHTLTRHSGHFLQHMHNFMISIQRSKVYETKGWWNKLFLPSFSASFLSL